jgi:hypothetical protein
LFTLLRYLGFAIKTSDTSVCELSRILSDEVRMAGASNDDRLDAQDPTHRRQRAARFNIVSLRSPKQLAKMPIWIEEGYVEPHYQKSTDGNASV